MFNLKNKIAFIAVCVLFILALIGYLVVFDISVLYSLPTWQFALSCIFFAFGIILSLILVWPIFSKKQDSELFYGMRWDIIMLVFLFYVVSIVLLK